MALSGLSGKGSLRQLLALSRLAGTDGLCLLMTDAVEKLFVSFGHGPLKRLERLTASGFCL